MPTESEAVKLLEELGLTEYEARCFVALSRVQKATAKEVSDLSDVPRSRVYDAVDRLHKRGLVDVQQSEPREYQAVAADVALDTLEQQYRSTVSDASDALSQLQRTDTQEEVGAWAIADHDHVTDRIVTLVDEAREEVYLLVVDEDMMEQRVVEALAAASERGVPVTVEVPSRSTAETFESGVPAATVRRTELASAQSEVEGKRLGRIVSVDRTSVLLSGVTSGPRPGQSRETAIWASGPDHGLVVGLRHLLGARIDDDSLEAST